MPATTAAKYAHTTMLATMPVSMPRRRAITHRSKSVERPARPMHVNHVGATVAAKDETLELILLDVFMPALPGPDLLEIMRKKNARSGVAVVFCSSMDPEPLARLADQHQADGFISKSSDRSEFLEAVNAILSRRRAQASGH